MAGERRFGTSFMGFTKPDVNSYIERMLKEFDERLKQKDDEIAILKNQNREIRIKYEDLERRTNQLSDDRVKIADAIIKAQEKAENILEEARQQAIEEKKKLESAVEEEKEKLVDIKKELKQLKTEVVSRLKKFDTQLSEVLDENEEKE